MRLLTNILWMVFRPDNIKTLWSTPTHRRHMSHTAVHTLTAADKQLFSSETKDGCGTPNDNHDDNEEEQRRSTGFSQDPERSRAMGTESASTTLLQAANKALRVPTREGANVPPCWRTRPKCSPPVLSKLLKKVTSPE